MNVVVSAIVDPWVTTFFFVVALAMKIQAMKKDLAPYDTRSFMIACKLAVSAVTEL